MDLAPNVQYSRAYFVRFILYKNGILISLKFYWVVVRICRLTDAQRCLYDSDDILIG
jgi:hypothetical protein